MAKKKKKLNLYADGGKIDPINVAQSAVGVLGSAIKGFNSNNTISDTTGHHRAIANKANLGVTAMDNDALMSEWGQNGLLKDNYSASDVRGLSGLQGFGNVLSSTISGASSGYSSGLGIPGAILGGGIGLVSSLSGLISGNAKARREARKLNADAAAANQASIDRFVARAEGIDDSMDTNLANTFAKGGQLKFGAHDRDIQQMWDILEGNMDTVYSDVGNAAVGRGVNLKWHPKYKHLRIGQKISPELVAEINAAAAEQHYNAFLGFVNRTGLDMSKFSRNQQIALFDRHYGGWMRSGSELTKALKEYDPNNPESLERVQSLWDYHNGSYARSNANKTLFMTEGDTFDPKAIGKARGNGKSSNGIINKQAGTGAPMESAPQYANANANTKSKKPEGFPVFVMPGMEQQASQGSPGINPNATAQMVANIEGNKTNLMQEVGKPNVLQADIYAADPGRYLGVNKYADGGLIEYEGGGTHEENPNGGIQVGVDPEGVPNMVEEGETRKGDYVFTNRESPLKATLDKLKIRASKNATYADISKKISKEAEERPNDHISKRGQDVMLERLALAQEDQKEMKKAIKDRFMQIQMAQTMESMPGRSMNMFNDGGMLKPGFGVHRLHGSLPNPANFTDRLKAIAYDHGGKYYLPNPGTQRMQTSGPSWGGEKFDQAHLRYAPAAMSGLSVLTDALGVTNKEDYSIADAVSRSHDGLRYTPYTPNLIQARAEYNPIDPEYQANQIRSQAAGLRSAIGNNSWGNRGSAMAGLISAGHNGQLAYADAHMRGQQANNAMRMQATQINAGIEGQNAQMMANAHNMNASHEARIGQMKASAFERGMMMRELERNRAQLSRTTNLNNLIGHAAALGEEAYNRNVVNSKYGGLYTINGIGQGIYNPQMAGSALERVKMLKELGIIG